MTLRGVSPSRPVPTSSSGRSFIPPGPVTLFPADVTWAELGPGSTTPTFDRQRGTLSGELTSVKVTRDTPAVLHLDAGIYWVVNTHGAELDLAPCDGGVISGVVIPTFRRVPLPNTTGGPSTPAG